MADTIGVNPNLAAGVVGPEVAKSALADVYRERIQWIKDAAGDRFDQLDLQVLTFMTSIVPNRDEVIANIAPMFGIAPEIASDIPLLMVGTEDEIVEQLQKRREEFGFNDIVVQGDVMDDVRPDRRPPRGYLSRYGLVVTLDNSRRQRATGAVGEQIDLAGHEPVDRSLGRRRGADEARRNPGEDGGQNDKSPYTSHVRIVSNLDSAILDQCA